FHGRRHHQDHAPASGFAGLWERVVVPSTQPDVGDWSLLCFFPSVLAQVLEEAGFDAGSTVRSWRDKGWMRTSKDAAGQRNHYRVRLRDRQLAWVVAITREAIEGAING